MDTSLSMNRFLPSAATSATAGVTPLAGATTTMIGSDTRIPPAIASQPSNLLDLNSIFTSQFAPPASSGQIAPSSSLPQTTGTPGMMDALAGIYQLIEMLGALMGMGILNDSTLAGMAQPGVPAAQAAAAPQNPNALPQETVDALAAEVAAEEAAAEKNAGKKSKKDKKSEENPAANFDAKAAIAKYKDSGKSGAEIMAEVGAQVGMDKATRTEYEKIIDGKSEHSAKDENGKAKGDLSILERIGADAGKGKDDAKPADDKGMKGDMKPEDK